MHVEVLAIGAHPDDIELSCGGTIARLCQQNLRVAILDLTAGEAGSSGTPEQRRREALAAAEILGVCERTQLDLPDGGLEDVPWQREKVAIAIRACSPDLVLFPDSQTRHPDHRAAHHLARSAVFLAGVDSLKSGDPPMRPQAMACFMERVQREPNVIVDVTPFMAQRRAAIAAFGSQFDPRYRRQVQTEISTPLFHRQLENVLRYFGGFAGVDFAEGFILFGPPLADNLHTFLTNKNALHFWTRMF